jgi:hypothetical protein
VDFTGLDPSKTYTFATSASRAKSTTDGAPGYTDRYSVYTISGVDAATNASTPGTQEYLGNPLSVWFNTGNNHDEGYVARWTGIRPGVDGTFKVRATATPSVNQAYAFDVFMLQSADEITQIAYPISYLGFSEQKVSSDSTLITIPTPGSSGAVAILGSWATGLTHAKESGTNRALIFIAHAEHSSGTVTLNSVTYGGQEMTSIIDESIGTGYSANVAAFILDEDGIAAATSGTFVPTWSTTPGAAGYTSVFIQNVNQTTLIGATDSASTTSSNPIVTDALSTMDGDMVFVAATCGNLNSYTLNNGFTEGTDQQFGDATTGGTGVAGYKAATGANETPSVTFVGTMNRQVLIGFVVKANEAEDIEGDLLIAAVATDGATSLTTPAEWELIDYGDMDGQVTLGAWWKIAEASEPSPTFTWTGVGQQAYGWIMRFTGHNAANPINASYMNGQNAANPISPAVNTTAGCSMILRLGAFDDDNINVDAPGLSVPSHTAITMDKSAATATPTYVAAGAVASGTVAIAPALPAGIAVDDILLLFLETSNQAISISNSNGGTWTAVANSPQSTGTAAGSTGVRLTAFWSRYNGTQGDPTTSSSGDHQLGRIIAIRGAVASGDPWDITAGGVEAFSDTSGSIPGATTTVANTLVVAAIATALPDSAGTANFSAWTNGNLTGILERTDNTVIAGNGGGLGIVTGVKATAGAYANTTVTCLSTTYKAMMSIALKPGGTVSGGAGYIRQSTAGLSSGAPTLPTFSLTAPNEAMMITIAIAPADANSNNCCGDVRP